MDTADDGKRFSSDGRCVGGPEACGIEGGFGGETCRRFPGSDPGGFTNIDYYKGRMVTFGVGSFFIFLLLLSV